MVALLWLLAQAAMSSHVGGQGAGVAGQWLREQVQVPMARERYGCYMLARQLRSRLESNRGWPMHGLKAGAGLNPLGGGRS